MTEYHMPESIPQALAIAHAHPGVARFMGGGTDLFQHFRKQTGKGRERSFCFIDITRIPELQGVNRRDGALEIGSAVSVAQVLQAEGMPLAIREAAGYLGSPQVRAQATVVGNVLTARPSADLATTLLALDAALVVACGDGHRIVPLEELYAGRPSIRVDSSRDLVVAVRVPLSPSRWGSAYARMGRGLASGYPVVNGASCAVLDERGRIARIRLAIAPVMKQAMANQERLAPCLLFCGDCRVCRNMLLPELSQLEGEPPDSASVRQALAKAVAPLPFRDSVIRGEEDYRRAMVLDLAVAIVERSLREAVSIANSDCRGEG